MNAVDQAAEVRRLVDGEGLSQRQIAKRLGISRYKVGQLLAEPVADQTPPVAEPADQVADEQAAVADQVAEGTPVRPMLVLDLDRFPGLAEDLALLERTGATAAEVVNFAVDKLASAYRRARSRGLLHDGQAFEVTRMWLWPRRPGRRRPGRPGGAV